MKGKRECIPRHTPPQRNFRRSPSCSMAEQRVGLQALREAFEALKGKGYVRKGSLENLKGT